MKSSLFRVAIVATALCFIGDLHAAVSTGTRERLRFDSGWRFHLGNEWGTGQNLGKAGAGFGPASGSFSDASWRQVELPHDWAIELPFDPTADASHGFKALGRAFPGNSVGWYRRTFELPAADANRRIWIEFDGVFRDCVVFVNGWFVGHHESGYSSFRYDITDVVNSGGSNVVAVKVDATEPEGWFYEGAGIYRHVWLVKTAPLAIAPEGVFVSSRFEGGAVDGPASVQFETELVNHGATPESAVVQWTVTAPNGTVVGTAEAPARLAPQTGAQVRGRLTVDAPQLWSPETPRLYRLHTTVRREKIAIDEVETEFGIRTFGFDAGRGFLLNGKPYVLKGTCNHQDHAGVGAALPDDLQYFRIARLKEMGGNAYRTSHNPPTPELLEACDRLGMLVMDENRLLGSDEANWQRWADLIRRDRNHASVAIWSVANEEFWVQATPAGGRVAAAMQDLAKRLDPTRPVTYAAPQGNEFTGVNEVIEVRGWNYHVGADMDAYHAARPAQPNVGTEQGSTVSTRGIYANDETRGYVSAYDENAPPWATTAKVWWSYFAARPWLSGGFVWTGFDYRGEPTPYAWPCINSHFGILDTCGFPKDNFWYYQSWWTERPVLHLLPHWNWHGREGQAIDVRALSNCDEVELSLNGKSLGRQAMPRNGELKWSVPYAAGVLSARGFIAGNVVAETRVETTGPASRVELAADHGTLKADGEALAVITVATRDAAGRLVPTAGNLVAFELTGPGRIVGVGNGDPSCHEPDVFVANPRVVTTPVAGWRLKRGVDPNGKTVAEIGADFDDSGWEPVDANAETGPLGLQERGVMRARFEVSAEQLNAPALELWFGKIEGGGAVWVNGQRVGDAGDPRAPSVYNVKPYLHAGSNSVAVTLANYGVAAGVNRGATLRVISPAVPAAWKRSTFNGLAQVIVQAGREPGVLRLTAKADGLAPAEISLPLQAASPRPEVRP